MKMTSERVRSAVRNAIPAFLLYAGLRGGAPKVQRLGAFAALLAYWSVIYSRYRARGRAQTELEREQLKSVSWEAFWRHYNERVPTIEEEFELWGPYHQH